MNLPSHNSKTKKQAWSSEELRLILRLAGKIPVEDLAEKLGRTVQAVQKKCQAQGLKFGFKSEEMN